MTGSEKPTSITLTPEPATVNMQGGKRDIPRLFGTAIVHRDLVRGSAK